MSARWRVELTRPANADLSEILGWTQEAFGPRQAASYQETLAIALEALRGGPEATGARLRSDLRPDVRLLRVARGRRRGRHVIVFRVAPNRPVPTIQVLRILHEAMDIARHIPAKDD